MRCRAVLALFLLVAADARAEDSAPAAAPRAPAAAAPGAGDPPTPKEAADAVLAALVAKDDEALRTLAGRRDPDPWAVADELCAAGRRDAATAFAAFGRGKDLEGLPDYLRAWRKRPSDVRTRELYLALNHEEDRAKVVAATEGLPPPRSIGDLRLHSARQRALLRLGRWDALRDELVPAITTSARIGWHAHRQDLLWRQATAFLKTGELTTGLSVLEEAAALARERENMGDLAKTAQLGAVVTAPLDLDRARPLFEEAARLHLENDDAASAARVLEALAGHLQSRQSNEDAIDPMRRALVLRRAMGDHAHATDDTTILHAILRGAGRRAEAKRAVEDGLAALTAAGRAEGRSELLDLLAGFALEQFDHAEAARLYGQSAEAARSERNPVRETDALLARSSALRLLGELRAASEACSAAQRKLGGVADGPERVALSGSLGLALHLLDRNQEAIPHLEAAAEASLLPEPGAERSAAFSAALTKLAIDRFALLVAAQLSSGRDADALVTARRLLRLAERSGDPRHLSKAHTRLGAAERANGERVAVIERLQRAVEFARVARDPATLKSALEQLALALEDLGDIARAADALAEVVAGCRAVNDRISLATALHALSECRRRQGRLDEGLAGTEEAIRVLQEVKLRAAESTAQNGLGLLLEDLGRSEEAGAAFRRSLELAREVRDDQRQAIALLNLARRELKRGSLEKAAELARDGRRLAEHASTRVRSDALGVAGAVARARGEPDEAIRLYRASARMALRDVDLMGEEEGARARAESLPSVRGGLELSVTAGRTGDMLYFLEIQRARGLLSALGGRSQIRGYLVGSSIRDAESAAIERRARAAKGRERALETGIFAELRHWAGELAAAEEDLAAVLDRLQRNAKAAAQIYCPEPSTLDGLRGGLAPGEALVIVGEGLDVYQALVLTREEARHAPTGVSLGSVDPEGEGLPGRLVPAFALGAGITRVILSLPAELVQLPWCVALPGRDVAFVPSATVWALLREQPPTGGKGVLALADPEVRGKLPRLPGASAEARSVADRVLSGEEATEQALRGAIVDPWHAIHLACHGVPRGDRPLMSALALSPQGDDDGWLQAHEVFGLRLRTDLAVLSACQSAVGRSYGGEGVLGLTRAFLYAGAPRVICSLWKVDDEATRALMERFYELWNPRDGTPALPAATALRKAQEFVASHERWKDARYWAAWQLWGLPS